MSQEKFEKTISLLTGVLDYESFRDVDMVIEVVKNVLSSCLSYGILSVVLILILFLFIILVTGSY